MSAAQIWKAKIQKNRETGRVYKTLDNCMLYFEHDPDLTKVAVDEMRGAPVWTGPTPWCDEARPLIDSDLTHARRMIHQRYGVEFSKQLVQDSMDAVATRRSFNKLTEYLDGLRWDGSQRIHRWLNVLAGAEPSDYVAEVGRRWLISAVARAFQPACKADHVLVLEGKQGTGKSTLLGVLGGEWYSDAKLDPTAAWVAVELEGVWIHETAEVEKLSRYEAANIKAFISRLRDDARMPYGHHKALRPRRCVFAASTNADEYLADTTGNRRWWPVRCGAARIDLARARDARDQLWAEAVAAYRSGQAWHLEDEALVRAAEAEQEDRAESHPWAEMLAEQSVGRDEWSIVDALRVVLPESSKITQADGKAMSAVLRQIGFTDSIRPRRYGHRIRVQRRPST